MRRRMSEGQIDPKLKRSPSLQVDVVGITPDESLATMPAKLKRWTRVVQVAGIRPG